MDATGPKSVKARQCKECGTVAPDTETEYTLISAQHKWRLSRDPKTGELLWRCPSCYKALKTALP